LAKHFSLEPQLNQSTTSPPPISDELRADTDSIFYHSRSTTLSGHDLLIYLLVEHELNVDKKQRQYNKV